MATLHHEFELCVGNSLDDAWFLARRCETKMGDRGLTPDYDRMEQWIGRVQDGTIASLWGTLTYLDSFARSPEGAAYTVASRYPVSGKLFESDGLWKISERGIEPFSLGAPSFAGTRLLSLTDGTVIVYGDSTDPTYRLRCFDGSAFREMPAPKIALAALHGLDDKLLVAGGEHADVALWDGRAWSAPERLGGHDIPAVLAMGPDRIYAASFLPSILYRRTASGWTKLAEVESEFSALAEYAGSVYVAVSEQGVHRVENDRLIPLPLPVKPESLHAGAAALILTNENEIADTSDFKKVRRIGVEELAAALADRAPLWETMALDSDTTRFVTKPERPEPDKPIEYAFTRCLGRGFDDAFFLVERGDDIGPTRWEADERESVVGRIVDGRIESITTLRPLVEQIDVSPAGRLYLAVWQQGAGLWRTGPAGTFDWEKFDVPGLQGLCVVDDSCVMCRGASGLEQHFFLFDGRNFRPIPAPPERVIGMDGCAPDWIVATGHNGLVARWDGQSWHRWPLAIRGALGAVHVVSPDEMYATGPTNVLVEGTRHGWAVRAEVPKMAVGVTKFKGDVFVGDPVSGLLRLKDDELEPVKLPVWPYNFSATDQALVMDELWGFTETRDLETVRRIRAYDLDVALRDHEPSWRK